MCVYVHAIIQSFSKRANRKSSCVHRLMCSRGSGCCPGLRVRTVDTFAPDNIIRSVVSLRETKNMPGVPALAQ